MKLTSTRLKRVLAGAAALAVVASILPMAGTAQALPPGTPAAGPVTLTPATGDSSTTFGIAAPVGAVCPGDNTNGFLFHTFITPFTNDPADFIWSPSGTPTGEPAFTNNLADSVGTRSRNIAPGLGDGLVIPLLGQTFSAGLYAALTPGTYNIGLACTQPDAGFVVQTMRFWSVPLTITASAGAGPHNFTYAVGLPALAPSAPVLNTVTPGSGSLTANFTPVPSSPATTSFTVTATPSGGGAAITASGAASPITVSGLANGTAYDVTVNATNSVGTSPESNVVTGTPTAGAQPPVTGLTAVPGSASGDIDVSWNAPAGDAPTGYTLTVTPVNPADPTVSGSPFTLPSTPTSFTVTGLPAGVVYTFEVVSSYADPSAVATPASVTAAAASAQTLQQEIQVERPAGALILTQRCGVNNALLAEPVDAGFPGFPAVDAIAATIDQIGTSPDINPATPAVDVDPEFGDYPFPSPATYPTKCVIDLGTATLLTTGDLAGQYYAADGALNEVTVVDTRQGDTGWTVTGSISSLSNGGTNPDDSFSGDLVGWTPVVTSDSAPVGSYDQVVTAGSPVVPGTTNGLSAASGQVLASAPAGSGLGIAVLDARVKVLIPVANSNGEYVGTLNLNAS